MSVMSKEKTWGKALVGVTGFTAVGICVVAFPFVLPALRRQCLPYVPATDRQVANVIEALGRRKGSVVDLGSGDGRVVIALAKLNYESHGVELNPWLVAYSRFNAFAHGVRTRFYNADLWKFSLTNYDNVVVFGVEQMMSDLKTKILSECKQGCNVVACRFPLPNLQPRLTVGHGVDTVWVYSLRR